MLKTDDILDRLTKITNAKSDFDLGKKLNLSSPSSLKNWRNRNSISFEGMSSIAEWAEKEHINMNYILYGTGEMLIENSTKPYKNEYAKKVANYIESGYAPQKFIENMLNSLDMFKKASLATPSF